MIPLLVPIGLGLIGGYLSEDSKKNTYEEGGKIGDVNFTMQIIIREPSKDGMVENSLIAEQALNQEFVFPDFTSIQKSNLRLGKSSIYIKLIANENNNKIGEDIFDLSEQLDDITNSDSVGKTIRYMLDDFMFVRYKYDDSIMSRYLPQTNRFILGSVDMDSIIKNLPEDDAYDVEILIYNVFSDKLIENKRVVKKDTYPFLYVQYDRFRKTIILHDDFGYEEVIKISDLDKMLIKNKNERIKNVEKLYGAIRDIRLTLKAELYAKYILNYNDGKFKIFYLG